VKRPNPRGDVRHRLGLFQRELEVDPTIEVIRPGARLGGKTNTADLLAAARDIGELAHCQKAFCASVGHAAPDSPVSSDPGDQTNETGHLSSSNLRVRRVRDWRFARKQEYRQHDKQRSHLGLHRLSFPPSDVENVAMPPYSRAPQLPQNWLPGSILSPHWLQNWAIPWGATAGPGGLDRAAADAPVGLGLAGLTAAGKAFAAPVACRLGWRKTTVPAILSCQAWPSRSKIAQKYPIPR
jgi:hypothetical protein